MNWTLFWVFTTYAFLIVIWLWIDELKAGVKEVKKFLSYKNILLEWEIYKRRRKTKIFLWKNWFKYRGGFMLVSGIIGVVFILWLLEDPNNKGFCKTLETIKITFRKAVLGETTDNQDKQQQDKSQLVIGITSFASLLTIFVLWMIRDRNKKDEIDNQRKDTNLKDFQQLSLWATGQHYKDHLTLNIDVTKATSQKITNAYEAGAEALQASAVLQLSNFLQGDFGKQFQRPTFQLLTQLTKEYTQIIEKEILDEIKKIKDTKKYQTTEKIRELIIQKNSNFYTTYHSKPLLKALHICFFENNGKALRLHKEFLNQINFSGFSAHHSALVHKGIDLAKLNLSGSFWIGANLSDAHLEGANLSDAHLEGADLSYARLEGANLIYAHLEGANLSDAHLAGAYLRDAHLAGAYLRSAHLEGANLSDAHLEGAYLRSAHLEGADLSYAHLAGADLSNAYLAGADLSNAYLAGADLRSAHLEGAHLSNAYLAGANLRDAHLAGADLRFTHLEGADLNYARLEGVKLINVRMDDKTKWNSCTIDNNTRIEIWHKKNSTELAEWYYVKEYVIFSIEATEALLHQMYAQGFPKNYQVIHDSRKAEGFWDKEDNIPFLK